MLRADQSDDIDDSQYLPLHLWGYAGLGDYLGFLGFFNDLTALQAQGYEPWSGVDCLAYVADTDAWYTWEEVQQAMSVGDVSPATWSSRSAGWRKRPWGRRYSVTATFLEILRTLVMTPFSIS